MTPNPPPPAAPPPAPQPIVTTATAGSGALTAAGLVVAVALLYFGKDIFVPFALAVLLSFALAPLVEWLRRRIRLPKVAAVAVAIVLAGAVIAGIGVVVAGQLIQLAGNLPTYQQTIKTKLGSLRSAAPGGGVVEKVTETIKDVSQELAAPAKPESPPPSAPTGQAQKTPVPVTIVPPELQPLQVLQAILGPLIAPLATAGLVVVFVVFMLIEKEDLRDRFMKLVGAGRLQASTEALNEAAARVSRYLLMQLVVNVTYGIPLGIGLYVIGVPNALLWGILAAVLRFIPYLGPFLAAVFPVALAFAVDPGWSMLAWTIALFLTIELVSNNIVEPWLYGASTGLSSFAIIISAIFWTTLWGPVGLFLATPLTVCLVVIGRYVPHLEFLDVLLGSDPVLAPEERLYQRLLAGNVEEAVEIAETAVGETSVEDFYDQVAIPAMRLAENDRRRTASDTDYRRMVADGMSVVLNEVAELSKQKAKVTIASEDKETADEPAEETGLKAIELHAEATSGADAPPAAPMPDQAAPTILCIGGRSHLDRVAAEMIAQILREDAALGVKVLSPEAVAQDALGRIDLEGVEVVCLSYFHPEPEVYARYLARRLKRRKPGLKIIVCLWNVPAESTEADTAERLSVDAVASSLIAARKQIEAWAKPEVGEPEAARIELSSVA